MGRVWVVVEIRLVSPEDRTAEARAELMAAATAAFLSSHGHMFSEEERALIREGTSMKDYRFTWTLPPQELMALAVASAGRVGYISLHRHPTRGAYGVIEPMNVHPDFQRQRVGSRLWKFIRDRSRELGDRGLRVWALDRSDVAMSFYRDKLGLRIIGKGRWWFRDHEETATGFQDDFYRN